KITLLLMLFVVGWGYAQANLYSFSASTAPYVETTSSAVPVPSVKPDSGNATLPIGFDFYYEGVLRTNFYMNSNGYISFGTSPTTINANDLSAASTSTRPIIAPLWDDLDGSAPANAGAY